MIIDDPRLMIRVDNKLYDKFEGIPLILSLLIYKQPLVVAVTPDATPTHQFEPRRPIDDKVYKKSIVLDSARLLALGLKKGSNHVIYTVESAWQGIQSCYGKIYLWDSNSKIVISDVDGTITKSDVLGQILPIVGKD